MGTIQQAKPFRHFARQLFLASKVYVERNKSKKEVDSYLQRMRKSVIRMSLGYSDVDKLRKKIDNLIDWERKYARFFKPEDNETNELKSQINALEQELRDEREEKYRIISENDEKVRQLTESLNSIKSHMKHILMEKAKRQQRLTVLDKKIREKVDVHGYFGS